MARATVMLAAALFGLAGCHGALDCRAARPFTRPAASTQHFADAPLRFAPVASSPFAPSLARAAAWLAAHEVQINTPDAGRVSLIAWWDPSLSTNQSQLVAYTLSDTLWSAWALRQLLVNSTVSNRLNYSLHTLGCASNGFFDQIFNVRADFHGHNNDSDRAHGTVLGGASCADHEVVAIRFPHYIQQPNATDRAMAANFVDFAVQYAFYLLWNGEQSAATTILRTAADQTKQPKAGIWFEEELGLLLDQADAVNYDKWKAGKGPLVYCPFKQALFVLAAREMALVGGGVAPESLLSRLEHRALDGQAADGSFCHRVELGADGKRLPLPAAHCGTGETTAAVALAVLALPAGKREGPKHAGGL